MCKCKWFGVILALIVIVFTLWTSVAWTKWLVVIAGLLMLFHAFGCFKCGCCETEMSKAKPKRKR
jgi:hypothetical protein